MVKGLVLMRWDERSGAEVLAKYPDDEDDLINEMTLFQIYGQHEYSGEAGVISLNAGSINIVSYYSGPTHNHYIVLVLEESEDPDDFESPLINSSRTIMQANEETYNSELSLAFKHISDCQNYNESQNLVLIYENEVKKLILNRLRVEGVVNKHELKVWIYDKFRNKFLDIDAIFNEMIKEGIIKESSIRGSGITSNYIFFVGDLILFRIPSSSILRNSKEYGIPENIQDTIMKEIENSFDGYNPSEEEALNIVKVLLNKDFYKIITELRAKTRTREELEVLLDDLEENPIGKMEEMNFIQEFKDKEDNRFYVLKSDIYIKNMFPEYILSIIKEKYQQNALAKEIIVEYLSILENLNS